MTDERKTSFRLSIFGIWQNNKANVNVDGSVTFIEKRVELVYLASKLSQKLFNLYLQFIN